MRFLESELQIQCVEWFKIKYPKKLIFSIPNGAKKSLLTALRMRREGLLSGVPDLFIPEPFRNFSGLFIEMKSKYGKLSSNQKDVIQKLRERNYAVYVCNSFSQFEKSICEYF